MKSKGLVLVLMWGLFFGGFSCTSDNSEDSPDAMTLSLAAPDQLSATGVSSSRIDLQWRDNSNGEDGFYIERAPADGIFEIITTLDENIETFSDAQLDPQTVYRYRVRAFCGTEHSNYSEEAFASTPGDTDTLYTPVQIDLPDYDPSHPQMLLIDENSDWDDINDADFRYFFVCPGDYTDYNGNGFIRLEASGSEEERRFLIYHDPDNPDDDTHPVDMAPDKQARINMFWLIGASYWIVDRITVVDSAYRNRIIGRGESGRSDVTGSDYPIDLGTSGPFTPSSSNILNRMLFEDARRDALFIYEGCHDNTIQNSVFWNRNIVPDGDWVGICLQGWYGRSGQSEITGTRIVSNEICNLNDGIQLFNHATIYNQGLTPNYAGTIIADNDIYITPEIYADGNGNLDPDGTFAAAENALDIKCASSSSAAADWVRIVDNRMWGFRFLDENLAGSSANGFAVVIHGGGSSIPDVTTGYLLMENNLIFDTVNGISLTTQQHVSINNNIVFDVKRLAHDGTTHPYEQSSALLIGGTDNEIYGNILINGDWDWQWTPSGTGSNWDFRNNVIVNFSRYYLANDYLSTGDVTLDYNAYYNSAQCDLPGTHDIVMPDADDSNNDSLFVLIKRITDPSLVEIPYGRTTVDSPHYNGLDPDVGSRPGLGVDDI